MIDIRFVKISKKLKCEVYNVFEDEKLIGRFYAYDNPFHNNNKYINPTTKTFKKLNKKKYFDEIKKYFEKPLQLTCHFRYKKIIQIIKDLGFVLKRTTSICKYLKEDILNLEIEPVKFILCSKGNKEYDEAIELSYKHYLDTHVSINAFTGTKEDFIKALPEDAICEFKDGSLVNALFFDEWLDCICYFGSKDNNTFKPFLYSAIKYLSSRLEAIEIEVDSTDPLALEVESLYKEKYKDIDLTFVFE